MIENNEEHTIQDFFKERGFRVMTPIEAKEKELTILKTEQVLCEKLQEFFLENPDKILDHPSFGVIKKGHALASQHFKTNADVRVKRAEEELKSLKKEEHKSTMRDSIKLIDGEGSNVLSFIKKL